MEINIYGTGNKTASKGGPLFQLGFVVLCSPGKQTDIIW